MKHNTKDKGDIGLAKIISDLVVKDIKVALPISEHLPFDLIAVRSDGLLSKVSVKYTKFNYKGNIEVPLRTISTNSKGHNIKFVDFSLVDAYAVYNPETDLILYLNKEVLKDNNSSVSFRVTEPKRKINNAFMAKDYLNVDNIWPK